mmetsp:Transcript_74063/g.214570  ORF Transcript_74063/g.214570 Transcript_74063/m.214570 type:complete len:305 (+) Transcript_74063:100-1014(+)
MADDVLRSMFAGAAATAVVRTAEAPLERIKILLQNQNLACEGHRPYTGAGDAALRVLKEQGFLAFWRGNLTNCVRVVPSSALRFTFMDRLQELAATGLPPSPGGGSPVLPLHRQMLSGAMSGALTSFVVFPLDLTRTKLAADVGAHRQFSGIIDCVRQTTRQHGWRGNYRGLFVSVLEITPYTALTMGGYEYFKRLLPAESDGEGSVLGVLRKVGVGWITGLVGSLVCYPLDTVKRQLMLDGSTGFQSKYGGSTGTCMRILYHEAGLRAFYRGCLFNAFKSAPSAALTLVANDAFRNLLGFRKR